MFINEQPIRLSFAHQNAKIRSAGTRFRTFLACFAGIEFVPCNWSKVVLVYKSCAGS